MIEIAVGVGVILVLAVMVFAVYRLGGSNARESVAEDKAKDAETEVERLSRPQRFGRSLDDLLRGKRKRKD